MNDIKPIETHYKDYRFRSRLEARWAVFFDALGIKWQYEPEGLRLGNGTLYLPDFYLPECNTFFEVKGLLADKDLDKIQQLIKSGRSVVLGFDAANTEAGLTFRACDHWGVDSDGQQIYELADMEGSVLCRCHACGAYFFTGYSGAWDCTGCGNGDGDHDLDFLMDGDGAITHDLVSEWRWLSDGSPDITISYNKGDPVRRAVERFKQARFEHGETPERRTA